MISFGIILIVYVLYLNYTGQEVPKTVEDLKKSVSGNVDKAKEAPQSQLKMLKNQQEKLWKKRLKKKLMRSYQIRCL